jgi:hypothetical protein
LTARYAPPPSSSLCPPHRDPRCRLSGAPNTGEDTSSTPGDSSWTPTSEPEPLPQQDQQGTDIHYDSAFRVYNEDEREHVVDIRLTRSGTDETVLAGQFVVPASASQRVVDLDSHAEYECLVRLGDQERRTSYETNRGKSLTLSIYDGEPSLGVEYTE